MAANIQLQNRLRDAVSEENRDTDVVKEIITDGADVNWKYPNERTALDYCVSLEPVYSSASESEYIKNIYMHTSTLTPNTHTHTLLYTPEEQKRLQKVNVLFEYGAKPNTTDKFGWTIIHQCAWNGDLPLLQLCVQKGGKIHTRNKSNQLPVELAATRGHTHVMRYLDGQSRDLRSICRAVICEALDRKGYDCLDELPLPTMVKMFLNHGNPYTGWKATVIPFRPWTSEELQENKVDRDELRQFICNNASEEFVEENRDILEAKSGEVSELVQVLQSMYLWEAFRDIAIQEPPARKPRYTMEVTKKDEDVDDVKITKPKKYILY